jgi:flavin reductase (DIM6/NTAB) family NADH-FMN oxidoreductase RutF
VAIGEDEFKQCLGSWPSGVTVLTTCAGGVIHGMTVSDFSGASLSPPLVTVCCNKGSNTTTMIAEGKCFAANILAVDQQELSNRFASSKTENTRFEGLDYTTGKTGAPLIGGAVVSMDCTLVATYDAGDHVIYLGEVEEVRVSDREPLLYCGGRYRKLGDTL